MPLSTSMWRTVYFPYLSYVALFLGMGLISGSIVHMPVSPVRYSLIMLIGVAMFGFASFVSDIAKQENLTSAGIVRALLFSLLVSVGIGMMSGGIQHWEENPTYSAMLIPSGLGLSLFSFIVKNNVRLSVKRFYGVVLLFIVLAIPLKFTLDYMAGSVAQTEGGGGHGH